MVKESGFRLMTAMDLEVVRKINTDFEISENGASEYIKRNCAYVLCEGSGVVGYLFFRVEGKSIAVDRIGASEPSQYAQLLIAMFYLSEEVAKGVDTLAIRFQTRNAMLRNELRMCGFFLVKDDGSISVYAKNMAESTWREGSFYAQGGMVIEEILNGECKVLGR